MIQTKFAWKNESWNTNKKDDFEEKDYIRWTKKQWKWKLNPKKHERDWCNEWDGMVLFSLCEKYTGRKYLVILIIDNLIANCVYSIA